MKPCLHLTVWEGGGAHYGDDLLICPNCGREAYPEAFGFHGVVVPRPRDSHGDYLPNPTGFLCDRAPRPRASAALSAITGGLAGVMVICSVGIQANTVRDVVMAVAVGAMGGVLGGLVFHWLREHDAL